MGQLRIGILTYHNAINYGAALQTVALYEYLSSNFKGILFEIIDYRNDIICKKNSFFYILQTQIGVSDKIKRILGLPQVHKKRKKFIQYTSSILISNRYDSKTVKAIENEYDYFIIGSDQLWNFELNKGDLTYLLPFIKNKSKIITYATSVGTSSIKNDFLMTFNEAVLNYGSLSVRERTAQQMIQEYTGRIATLVVDPVLLVDRSKWMNCITEEKKQYVTMYLFNKKNIPIIFDMMEKSEMDKCKIKKISGGFCFKDYLSSQVDVCITSGPKEFLEYVRNAQYVFTDSFHCVALSIVFHKAFTVFLSGNDGPDSRIVDLVNSVGLQDRIYRGEKKCSYDIDWLSVDSHINLLQEKSREYLNVAFKSIQ